MLKAKPLSAEERQLPYAKYYDIPLDEIGLGEREAKIVRLQLDEVIPCPQAAELLRRTDIRERKRTGYYIFPEGRVYNTVSEFLPGVTPAMMDWYFKWMGTRPSEGGCEWISGSWSGYTIKEGKAIPLLVSAKPDEEAIKTELLHNLTERRQLRKFLPQLYADYGRKAYWEDD